MAPSALKPGTARETLLAARVCDLGLKLEGSPVAPLIGRLRRELRRKGLCRFRPEFYLTDEWGCPSGQPIIGIPFYLAHTSLQRIEREWNDLETAHEIMMYLRHEAGHAFNYAYRIYQRPEWRAMFGPYGRRYREEYRPEPFSRNFVRHLPGWYAQKHPDEDFAETFAVWLTPGSGWARRYRGQPSLAKLEYVHRLAGELADSEPRVRRGRADWTVSEMKLTVGQIFDRAAARSRAVIEGSFGDDLEAVFLPRSSRRKRARPAWRIVEEHRVPLTDKITYWTGVRRPAVRALVRSIVEACRARGYLGVRGREPEYLVALTAYGTTLALQYLARGKFHRV
ncbi:MAG TPA: hypothetical protein VID50_01195 [Candidatus Eisenbacteria bacterium]|jgi:hypothetical protein